MDANSFPVEVEQLDSSYICEVSSSETSDCSQNSCEPQPTSAQYLFMPDYSKKFKVEGTLQQNNDTKVMVVLDMQSNQILVAKTTEINKNAPSVSIHLCHENQFYTKLNTINSKYLIKTHNFGYFKSQYIRVMDYACRGTVRDFCNTFCFSSSLIQKNNRLKIVKNILWEVIKGLQQIHNLGFALRDIKPQNLLINHDGKVLLSDFGLVTPFGTIDDSICGTPQYMPPERLSKKRVTTPIDASVDMWSIGVLAFQLLMGYTPYSYEDEDINGLLESIYGGYASFDQDYPSYCRNFIFNLLQTNPLKRMSLEKLKHHQFFYNIQQTPLLFQRCNCQLKK